MHLGLRELESFLQANEGDAALVLATVVATEGSSYRKPGAMMLVRQNAEFAGLISGGCLEGDLVEHANAVFGDGRARRLTYDLSSDDEAIWSLGLGCGGVVHLLLQRLDRDSGFGALPPLFEAIGYRRTCVLALVQEADGGLGAGAWALIDDTGGFAGDARLAACLQGLPGTWGHGKRYRYAAVSGAGADDTVLLVRIEPSPRILVCGAGPDAVPVVRLVDSLGWECVVADHRPAYAKAERFPSSALVVQLTPDRLGEAVDLETINAALVMTHNLAHDETYLRQLLNRDLAYLGLLGPPARRAAMQDRLGIGDGLIHGPAGLDIGAELPESIALSVVAEIHAVLDRAGRGAGGRG